MLFRNLLPMRLPSDWALTPIDLEEKLITRPLRPCNAFEMWSRGWVQSSPEQRLVHAAGEQHLIALGVEQKLLPASLIRQVAADRAAELAAEQGFAVGRKQLRDLQRQVADELRGRALCKRRQTAAWLDVAHGWLCIDSAGGSRADEVVETLRDTLGSFAAVPPQTERSPQSCMARWLAQDQAPPHFTLDDELELKGQDKSRAVLRWSRHPLDIAEIKTHMADGLVPTRLGLTWRDRVSFVLTDKLQLKRIQFIGLDEPVDDAQQTDPKEQFDAEFLLVSGELSLLLADLMAALNEP